MTEEIELHPMDNEDKEILEQNERYLWDHIAAMAAAVKAPDKWEQFKELVGEELALQMFTIVDQGPDPRIPA